MLLVTFEKKQYDEALEMYNNISREAISFADKDVITSIVLNNLGYLYYHKKEYKKSKRILFAVLTV